MSDFTPQLQNLIKKVGIPSLKALGRSADVSERQILRLRRGEVDQMRVSVLLKLSEVLKISLGELVTNFSDQTSIELPTNILSTHDSLSQVETLDYSTKEYSTKENELLRKITELEREYSLLQQQLEQQQEKLKQDFVSESLHLLESLLVQFPTAARAIRENPQLPAVNILPLVQKPLERLQQTWGVEAIASVGEEIPYDPQFHQLMEGTAQPGETVRVRYIGYRQNEKLLYRAKVSPV